MASKSKENEVIDPDLEVHVSSGNVFADLGLPNPEELLLKAQLVVTLADKIKATNLSQAKVAAILGLDQPKVSELLRGRTRGYSVDRLLQFLVALNQDVTILITQHADDDSKPAKVSVRTETDIAEEQSLKKAV